jgi:hypothetical protein
LSRLGVGSKRTTSLGRADGDGDRLFFSLELSSGLDSLVPGLDGRRNSAVKTLESHCPAHADKVTGNIFITLWNLGSTEDGGVVPNPNCGSQLSYLAIIHECSDDLWQSVAGAIGVGTIDSWTMSEDPNEAAKVWQHHLGWEICTRTHAVIISKILGVLVLPELGIGEDSTPG